MSFTITHIDGTMEQEAAVSAIPSLVDELREVDGEHTDVAVSDESGWTLSAFSDGRLVWENVDGEQPPVHLGHVPRDEVIRLFQLVGLGQLSQIAALSWQPGYH